MSAAAVWGSDGSDGHRPFPAAGVPGASAGGAAWSAVKDTPWSGASVAGGARFGAGNTLLQGRPRGRAGTGSPPPAGAGAEPRRRCAPAASADVAPVLPVGGGAGLLAGAPTGCGVVGASLGLGPPGAAGGGGWGAGADDEVGWAEGARRRGSSSGRGCGCAVGAPAGDGSLWACWEGSQLAGRTGRRLRGAGTQRHVWRAEPCDQRVDRCSARTLLLRSGTHRAGDRHGCRPVHDRSHGADRGSCVRALVMTCPARPPQQRTRAASCAPGRRPTPPVVAGSVRAVRCGGRGGH